MTYRYLDLNPLYELMARVNVLLIFEL